LILYELMTGQLPFEAKTPLDMMKAHVKDPPIPVSQRVHGLRFSPELEATITKALAKRPDDRYPTAADFGEALRGCLHEPPAPSSVVPAVPSGLPQPEPSPLGRSSSAAAALRADTQPALPISRAPSLLIGLIIGIGFATACYFAFGQFLR